MTEATQTMQTSVDAQGSTMNEIDFEIMWNRLIGVVEEQAQALRRTDSSPIVRQSGDLSAGSFDHDGRMVAQAVTGTPGHVNTMATSVLHFRRLAIRNDEKIERYGRDVEGIAR